MTASALEPGTAVAGLTINQAAQRLGVSPDTVRRHIQIGLLRAHQKPRGRGYQWIVDVPESPTAGRSAPGQPAEAAMAPSREDYERLDAVVRELRRTLDVVNAELEARRDEVRRLLGLLEAQSQSPERSPETAGPAQRRA